MNLYLRLLIIFIASYFKPKIADILATSVLRLRVWPNDLDLNVHMNNGRYLTIMDLGRLDLVLRTGLLKVMIRRGCLPVLSAASIRYRLPLGWLGSVAAGWKVEAQVDEIFAYRARRIAERFGDAVAAPAREPEAEAA